MTGESERATIYYHDLFDYPLTQMDLIRWRAGRRVKPKDLSFGVSQEKGYYTVRGRSGLIFKRTVREKNFSRKRTIGEAAARILARIPTVKGVALTGSLAMQNAKDAADIDFLVICAKGTLWTTRLVSFILLRLAGIPTRRFGDRVEKDKICLNLWLDESALVWPKRERSVYTAHEICQIIPLVDKEATFARFFWQNKWVKAFWPNAMGIKKTRAQTRGHFWLFRLVEPFARLFQYRRMRRKITRERVSQKKALFHPQDWGEIVLQRFYS